MRTRVEEPHSAALTRPCHSERRVSGCERESKNPIPPNTHEDSSGSSHPDRPCQILSFREAKRRGTCFSLALARRDTGCPTLVALFATGWGLWFLVETLPPGAPLLARSLREKWGF